MPVGLVDQLWWVTNVTDNSGPADIGVPPFTDANGNQVTFPTLFRGGDPEQPLPPLEQRQRGAHLPGAWRGHRRFAGQILTAGDAGAKPQPQVDAVDDTNDAPGTVNGYKVYPKDDLDDNPDDDTLIVSLNYDTQGFNNDQVNRVFNSGGQDRWLATDDQKSRVDTVQAARDIREIAGPSLVQDRTRPRGSISGRSSRATAAATWTCGTPAMTGLGLVDTGWVRPDGPVLRGADSGRRGTSSTTPATSSS